MTNDKNITFEIIRHIGVVSESPTGWLKEVNLISWGGGTPKYDIRDWSPDHERMSKGITLTENEARKIAELISSAE